MLRVHIANLRRKIEPDTAAPALHHHRSGRGLPLLRLAPAFTRSLARPRASSRGLDGAGSRLVNVNDTHASRWDSLSPSVSSCLPSTSGLPIATTSWRAPRCPVPRWRSSRSAAGPSQAAGLRTELDEAARPPSRLSVRGAPPVVRPILQRPCSISIASPCDLDTE